MCCDGYELGVIDDVVIGIPKKQKLIYLIFRLRGCNI